MEARFFKVHILRLCFAYCYMKLFQIQNKHGDQLMRSFDKPSFNLFIVAYMYVNCVESKLK